MKILLTNNMESERNQNKYEADLVLEQGDDGCWHCAKQRGSDEYVFVIDTRNEDK